MGTAEDKAAVRVRIRARRKELAADWVAEASRLVQTRAAALREFGSAQAVACYVALPGEVQTDALIERCRALGRRVCVPARRGNDGSYALRWLDAETPLKVGPMGVREPAAGDWVHPGEVGVVLVPGLAFDAAGNRLGHGGGHYDGMLRAAEAAATPLLKVGLAFDFQVLERVPAWAGDVQMDAVVTETRTMRCAGSAAAGRSNAT
jgi:5-formyltetrahydrofolate cyclo-ligase